MTAKVRIGVVGYGLVGRQHVRAIGRAPGIALAGIAEPTASARAVAAAEGHPVFDSLDALLERGRLDGVLLATPTPLHVDQGLTCLDRGLPTLIEKPIAVTSTEARRLTEMAATRHVPLLVGHHRRHSGLVRAAKALIARGEIGEIRGVQATCWLYKPDTYFAEAPWRTRKGAGPISVNLVHDVDLLRHFCGEVAAVQATAAPSRRGHENEDLAAAILTFAGGAVATISVSDGTVGPWSWELTAGENPVYPKTDQAAYLIGGTEGALSVPDLRFWRHEGGPDWWAPLHVQRLEAERDDPILEQILHFARVIAGGEAPLVSGEEGLRSLRVVEAVAEAAATGQIVRLVA